MQAQSSCGATINPIVVREPEAWRPGVEPGTSAEPATPRSRASPPTSARRPARRCSSRSTRRRSNYRLDIYRMGYYSGTGRAEGRDRHAVGHAAAEPAELPDQRRRRASIDCGNWAVSASWTVPADAVSGIYFAKLDRIDTGGVEPRRLRRPRSDDAAHKSDLLFQTSDTTWQAYNNYGGNSLYEGGPGTNPARAYKVSYNRPLTDARQRARGRGLQRRVPDGAVARGERLRRQLLHRRRHRPERRR